VLPVSLSGAWVKDASSAFTLILDCLLDDDRRITSSSRNKDTCSGKVLVMESFMLNVEYCTIEKQLF